MQIEPRNPKKKCISKKCDDCNFFRYWELVDAHGQKKTMKVCSFDVVCQTIPKIVGSIDGVQAAANESRNAVIRFGSSSVRALKTIAKKAPLLLNGS